MGEVLKEGKVLKGRYEIIRRLEESQDGALYLARDKQGQTELVKIREIRTKTKSSGKNTKLELAKKEALILGSLSHSGIPKFVDFFPGVDSHFILTEYVEGDYLEDMLRNRGTPYTFEEVASWGAQLCEILYYLHTREKPVIVRGIQPSSILVTFRGEVKLMNFGMARMFDEVKTIDTVFVWNPGYTSPEQYGKQKSDTRSDIYSFGATMYNLLTNKDVGSLNFNFPPISQININIPSDMETVLMKCLAINPDERYQSINLVQKELEGWIERRAKGGSKEKPGEKSAQFKKKGGFIAKMLSIFKKKEF